MPGIEELLPRLVEQGVLLGLVTGNIEAAAHIKLARADLNRFFAFGGYGSDSRDRTELTKKALERGGDGRRRTRSTSAPTIAVGDTPRDVSAGHGAGIQRRRRRHRQLQRSRSSARPAPTGRSDVDGFRSTRRLPQALTGARSGRGCSGPGRSR